MAHCIAVLSLLTIYNVFYKFTLVWYSVKQGTTHRSTSNLAHLEHSTLALAMSWAYMAMEFAGLGWPVFVGVAFQPRSICWHHTWPSNQAGNGAILTSSSFLDQIPHQKESEISVHIFCPHKDNRIRLLNTVRSRRWKNNFYGTLEGTSNHRIAVGHTIRTVSTPHVQVYTVPQCDASQGGCCHHKNFLRLAMGLCWSACILLICPSKPTQSDLPSFLSVCVPFSISIFSVQSQGVWLFCLAVPYHMSLFSLSLSHLKVLAMKKKYK
jgi:hypothetical protein